MNAASWVLAIATGVLALATIGLLSATWYYARATKELAKLKHLDAVEQLYRTYGPSADMSAILSELQRSGLQPGEFERKLVRARVKLWEDEWKLLGKRCK